MEPTQNRQESTKNPDQPEQATSSEQGRQAGSAQPAATGSEADISATDQQEGQMNNGELGGNFDEAKNTETA